MKITVSQLKAWNHYRKGLGIGFNENYNQLLGLPLPEVRKFLGKLHSEVYGLEPGTLTITQVRKALAR